MRKSARIFDTRGCTRTLDVSVEDSWSTPLYATGRINPSSLRGHVRVACYTSWWHSGWPWPQYRYIERWVAAIYGQHAVAVSSSSQHVYLLQRNVTECYKIRFQSNRVIIPIHPTTLPPTVAEIVTRDIKTFQFIYTSL